jgi:hypothetical protein
MKKDFFVGPRKQGIPEFAQDKKLGCRWYYLRLFSVAPYKGQTHIVRVYRQIVHQAWDKDYNWINQFAYSEDYEGYNNGQFSMQSSTVAHRDNALESLDDAYKIAAQRFEKISNLWPIIEDVKLIEQFAMPRLLSVSVP